ncbi:CU044_2847 family protein [Streptomyces solicathayae]|uniref:CU044_2847 family protein n=1 Tax=Streptomyces solicathayae TaxID=3081768 RepID=A0ABZ0LLX2_9ACTN|nr:CU044_2847 family protein [Streptomyces sp. HUAS YS2]WOX20439.1 CU044_2847 family protein [Streptomyces sp. HUAS YS2]
MSSQLVQLEMPDGQVLWATVAEDDGPSDSGLGDRLTEKLHGFHESLQVVATNVRDAVASARPDEVSVEFGLELAAGESGVVAALVGGSGKAAFKVTLTWNGVAEHAAPAPQAATGPVPVPASSPAVD